MKGTRWILLLGSGIIFAFSYASANGVLGWESFCAVQTSLPCPKGFGKIAAAVDISLAKTKEKLSQKPTAVIATQVDRLLAAGAVSQITPEEEVKARYIHRRLNQRKDEIKERIETVSVPASTLQSFRVKYPNDKDFLHSVRQVLIRGMVANGFTHFVSRPYGEGHGVILDQTGGTLQVETIVPYDDLDRWLLRRRKAQKKTITSGDHLYLPPSELSGLQFVYLFKSEDDIQKLGYILVSSRRRKNTDEAYRRHNIKTSFEHIGPVRVVMPGETISFLGDSDFDPNDRALYKVGKVISSDEEVNDYGGGLCGGATALYQGTVTNRGLSQKLKNHSKRFTNLYTSTIDGVTTKTPGIDATIFSPNLDFQITNTRTYPIVIVMNYDGEYKTMESVFTLGRPDDMGSLEYVGRRKFPATLNTKEGKISVLGKCYSWLINGIPAERCYKEIK